MKLFPDFLIGALTGTICGMVAGFAMLHDRLCVDDALVSIPQQQESVQTNLESVHPSLYICSDKKDTLYLLVSPTSYEFAIFDETGAWVTTGQFFDAETDKGVPFLQSIVDESLIGFVQKGEIWHLAIVMPAYSTDLTCK